MTTTILPPGGDPTAVVGRRIGAFLLDMLLVMLIVLPIGVSVFMSDSEVAPAGTVECVGADDRPTSSGINSTYCFEFGDEVRYMSDDDANRLSFLMWGTATTISVLNLVVLQGLTGGSVGKLILGLRVVRMDTGRRAGFGWIVLRWILLIIDGLCCGLLPGIVLVASTKGHRRLGDMAAGTLVVRREHIDQGPIQVPGLNAPAVSWGGPQAGGWGAPPQAGGWGDQPGTGWGGPQAGGAGGWPSPPTPGAPAGGVDPSSPSPDEPTWDDARQAYIQYDRDLGEWMQWDETQKAWKPISR